MSLYYEGSLKVKGLAGYKLLNNNLLEDLVILSTCQFIKSNCFEECIRNKLKI